jgi:hypothetical protein
MGHVDTGTIGEYQPAPDLPPREGLGRLRTSDGVVYYMCGACTRTLVELGALVEGADGVLIMSDRTAQVARMIALHRGSFVAIPAGTLIGNFVVREPTYAAVVDYRDVVISLQAALIQHGDEHDVEREVTTPSPRTRMN